MLKRILALFLVLVFAGGVAVTSWPGLRLPVLDFVFDSARLSQDHRVRQVQPAVVRITVLARPERPAESGLAAQQRGTGFNVDPAGVIVTNHHVVRDAVRIVVTFPDGRIYNARSWSGLPDLDLAVVTLEDAPPALPVARLAEKERHQAGDPVLVVGNPLGLQNIVVAGTLGRTLPLPDRGGAPVLELLAPIHPGHSGGPVVDETGRVIGVVFGSFQVDGETRGLALPARHIRDYLAELPGGGR